MLALWKAYNNKYSFKYPLSLKYLLNKSGMQTGLFKQVVQRLIQKRLKIILKQ